MPFWRRYNWDAHEDEYVPFKNPTDPVSAYDTYIRKPPEAFAPWGRNGRATPAEVDEFYDIKVRGGPDDPRHYPYGEHYSVRDKMTSLLGDEVSPYYDGRRDFEREVDSRWRLKPREVKLVRKKLDQFYRRKRRKSSLDGW